MNHINEQIIEDIALGASLLGSGGGGDPHIGKLMALNSLKKYGPIRLIQADQCKDDDIAAAVAIMGAPSVIVEKVPNGEEFIHAFTKLQKYLGVKIAAVYPIEIGGINSMIPMLVAARLGIPLLDCDPMGRAFPELHMVTFHLNQISATPMAIADEKGNSAIFETINNKFTETFARSVTVDMGAIAAVSLYPVKAELLKKYSVKGSFTLSATIGRAIRQARNQQNNLCVFLKEIDGYHLFTGKVTDIVRRLHNGFNYGTILLEGLESHAGKTMHIEFQNENLIAKVDGTPVAITPDLISVINLETLIPLTTESLKWGKRVHVIGLKSDPQWRTPKGLETVGPRYFGYNVEYKPIENLNPK